MSPTSSTIHKCDPQIKVLHGISMIFETPWKTKVMSSFSTLLHGFLRSCRRASVTQALTPESPVFLRWKWCEMMFLLHSESVKIQFLIRRAKHGPAISAQSWPRTPYPYKKSSVVAFCKMMILILSMHLRSCTKASTHSLGLPQASILQSVHFCPAAISIWQKGVCTPLEALYKHVDILANQWQMAICSYSQSKPCTHLGAKDPPRIYHTDGTSQGVTMSPPTVRTQTTLRAYEESKALQDPKYQSTESLLPETGDHLHCPLLPLRNPASQALQRSTWSTQLCLRRQVAIVSIIFDHMVSKFL